MLAPFGARTEACDRVQQQLILRSLNQQEKIEGGWSNSKLGRSVDFASPAPQRVRSSDGPVFVCRTATIGSVGQM